MRCRFQPLGCVRETKDKNGAPYYLHHLGAAVVPPPPLPPSTREVADLPTRHRVNARILQCLSLSGSHRADLRGRGMSDAQIDRAGFRTWPLEGRAALLRRLREEFDPDTLLRVPGVWVDEGRMKLAGSPGLLIPVRDAEGNTVACMLRSDAPKGPNRYSWLSSGTKGGPSSGTPPHTPLGTPRQADTVRAVEGLLKAEVTFALDPSVPCVGFGGCDSWKQAVAPLKAMGCRTVRLAMDGDWRTNDNVRRALLDAVPGLTDAGFVVLLEDWIMSDETKGIDDALKAGATITPRQPEEVLGEQARGQAPVESKGGDGADQMPNAWGRLHDLAGENHREAINLALEADSLDLLARRTADAPGEVELLFRRLRDAGATVREIESLRRTINRHARAQRRSAAISSAVAAGNADAALLSNYESIPCTDEQGRERVVNEPLAAQVIAERLAELTGGWPRRAGNLLFAEGPNRSPHWIESASALFGWMHGAIPPQGDRPGIRWCEGTGKVAQSHFYRYLQTEAEGFDAVDPFPHEPSMPGHYYMHPEVEGGDGKAFDGLLAFLEPATDVDAYLIEAFFLSLLWGGRPGTRPAWLFTANESDAGGGRGIGKSTVAEVAGELLGGAVTVDPDAKMSECITRLLSSESRGSRILLLDNLKTLRFSWSQLESLITIPVISGHQMYQGEGRRPNTFTVAITLNGANLSRDMATRCVIVQMSRPKYSGPWKENVSAYIERHRWAIIGDIVARLRRPAVKLDRHGRWAAWEDAVLARLGDPVNCQQVILDRQGEVDADMAEADMVAAHFAGEIERQGYDPETSIVFIRSAHAARLTNEATQERRSAVKACAYLYSLGIPTLRRTRDSRRRGAIWTGTRASVTGAVVTLRDPQNPQANPFDN